MRARRFHFCHPTSIAFPDTGRGRWDRIRGGGGENADFGVPALVDSVCVCVFPIRSKIQRVILFGCFMIMLNLGISLVAD